MLWVGAALIPVHVARGSGELVGKVSDVVYCLSDKYFGISKLILQYNPEQSHRLGYFRLLITC